MKSFQNNSKEIEKGRAIAQGMRIENAQREKNMAKAEKRTNTMLERQAERALSGGVNYQQGRERFMRPQQIT